MSWQKSNHSNTKRSLLLLHSLKILILEIIFLWLKAKPWCILPNYFWTIIVSKCYDLIVALGLGVGWNLSWCMNDSLMLGYLYLLLRNMASKILCLVMLSEFIFRRIPKVILRSHVNERKSYFWMAWTEVDKGSKWSLWLKLSRTVCCRNWWSSDLYLLLTGIGNQQAH